MSHPCGCGHAPEEHHLVPGFDLSPGVTLTVNDDPTQHTSVPDVWVCGGGREVADPTEDMSPWGRVCGCVLHADPATTPPVALDQIGRAA